MKDTITATAGGTIAAALFPTRTRWSHPAILAVVGALIIAISAQVSIPIGTVPFTMQTVAILTLGMAYGWRLGGVTLLLYLFAGGIGLPVFAGGKGGAAALVGPSAGYLWGFVFAAMLVGWLAEKGWDRSFSRALTAMILGSAVLFIPGVLWLGYLLDPVAWGVDLSAVPAFWADALLADAGWKWSLYEGLWKFRYSESAKLVLAASTLPVCWKLIGRRSEQRSPSDERA